MSTCPVDTRPKAHKNPTTSDTIRQFVKRQNKLAWAEANKSRDASPEKLVQLGGIKHIEKAYRIVFDLLVEQIFFSQMDVSLSESKRKELFNSVVGNVETKIEELMQQARTDLDDPVGEEATDTPQTAG